MSSSFEQNYFYFPKHDRIHLNVSLPKIENSWSMKLTKRMLEGDYMPAPKQEEDYQFPGYSYQTASSPQAKNSSQVFGPNQMDVLEAPRDFRCPNCLGNLSYTQGLNGTFYEHSEDSHCYNKGKYFYTKKRLYKSE